MQGSNEEVQAVVNAFWGKRDELVKKHLESGVQGGAARSGSHMKAIQNYVRMMFVQAGLPEESVHAGSPSLPGYFRRSKSWDVVVSYKGALVAAIELKSQVGSVGNNANNRIEEALGNAVDVGAVQKNNGTFGEVPPWLAFIMVLEETPTTERSLPPRSTVFPQDPAFSGVSYSGQYQLALSRFVGEKLYDAGWFLTTKREGDGQFSYREPLATATAGTLAGLIQARVDFVKQVVDGKK
ncbi:PaeR7I family type II restriction endonuclease [Arthrobacter sp. NPDC089319]|uniref:PaeR7I family type II restriction endonuclease n=1 Tax=Arthrobacter sp. NPDC089319 TaxID=3155915 RepID=UPI003423CAEF